VPRRTKIWAVSFALLVAGGACSNGVSNDSVDSQAILHHGSTSHSAASHNIRSGGADLSGSIWQTVFFDDFSENALDRTKWTPEVSCWGGGNNERQCYRDNSENIAIENGILRLIAKKGTHEGPLYPPELQKLSGGVETQEYTSGKIRTRGLAAYKYGRFSARIKLPDGQATWPAFWMMPEKDVYGGWPLSGEIDIMEAVNLETSCEECPGGVERRTSAALHFGGAYPDNTYLHLKTRGNESLGPSKEFRVYTVEWGREAIQWLVDGAVFMRIEHDDWYSEAPEAQNNKFAPFDQPFYVMLNLAVGGDLAEKSNEGGFDPTSFPAELQVDWVRVEQCREDQKTGMACLSNQEWSGQPQGPWEIKAQ